jgi:PAS domain S-box-containing protein
MSAGERPRPPSRWRFILVAATAPLMIALLVGWTGAEYARSIAAQEEAARSFARERAQLRLLSAVKDAETAQRGFLLTGDAAFLAPYAPARATATRLRALPGVAPPAAARLIDVKFAELDRTIALYRAGDIAAARREVASGGGKRVMDRLRDEVAEDSAAERARTTERSAAFVQHRDDTYRLLAATGALFSVALLAIVLVLWRSRVDRYAVACAAHDVAERNAAILASTSDTLLIVDPGGAIEMVNDAGCALLGYPAAELERRDLATVLPLDGAGRGGDVHARIGLREGRPARGFLPEQPVRRRDGSEVIVDVTVGVMRVPDGDHLVLSLRDASERARAERAKDELISTVSHELRTPLTSVVGSLALLRAGTPDDWPPQARRLVDIADNNARRLIRLVNDMLDIDRIESGQLAIARDALDLRTIVAQAALDAEGLARSRNVTLRDRPSAAPVMVEGDGGRLLQVVTNLTSNAIHASREGGVVTLATRSEGGRAIVAVADRGPGVPTAVRPRLFRRFQSERASGGTGLGLAISREIVRRLDGTIWFEDRAGGGTRFVFDLPLLAVRSPAAAASGPLPVVLHVDDDPDLRETVAVALAGVATMLPAASLGAARAALHGGAPALALLDMEVVDGHGPELIPELVDRDGRALPIVILSGQTVPAEMAARAAVVLTKGRHDMADVVATVTRLLPARGAAA